MIVFDLVCKCGFEFEGWFSHRQNFSAMQAEGCIECPSCGSTEIRKILSPVAVQTATPAKRGQGDAPGSPEKGIALSEALRTLQEFVERNFENVGPEFTSEALKIHYGVTKERNIRGVATAAEEKTLQEEGVSLLKIPMPARGKKVH